MDLVSAGSNKESISAQLAELLQINSTNPDRAWVVAAPRRLSFDENLRANEDGK